MLKTIEQHNEGVIRRLEEEIGAIYKTGVECPKCRTELHFTDPYSISMSYPPRRKTTCLRCGFECTILVG